MKTEQKNRIIQTLNDGGVVLIATDTVYGLAALPSDENAVNKIYELKNRPKNMYLPIMISKIEALESISVDINNNVKKILNSYLVPGAITCIVGFNNDNLKPKWLSNREEIAFRIPNNELLLSVLDEVGILLVTSANLHGVSSTPSNVKDILEQLNGTPDLIIEDGLGKEVPSTIINCRTNPPTIERSGLISEEKINFVING